MIRWLLALAVLLIASPALADELRPASIQLEQEAFSKVATRYAGRIKALHKVQSLFVSHQVGRYGFLASTFFLGLLQTFKEKADRYIQCLGNIP